MDGVGDDAVAVGVCRPSDSGLVGVLGVGAPPDVLVENLLG
ncbi:MAG: hypothetical protein AB9879_08570 [Methanothrix sp.]